MNSEITASKTHIPAEGRGTGLNQTSECGEPMRTQTGDIAQIRRRIHADVLHGNDGEYCLACLEAARWVPVAEDLVVHYQPGDANRYPSYSLHAPGTTQDQIAAGAPALALARKKPSLADFANALRNLRGR